MLKAAKGTILRMKKTFFVLALVLILISGVITVYAVSAEADSPRPAAGTGAVVEAFPADYAAEEMAVEAYYQNQSLLGEAV